MKLITNGYIITMDKEGRVYRRGGVVFDGSSIVEVGNSDELINKYSNAEIIDAEHKVVMPGLIDSHVHLFQALFRGLGDDLSLIEWLQKCIWPLSKALGRKESKIGALLCALEMVKTGTTSFVDSHYITKDKECYDGIAEAIEELGIRGTIVRSTINQSPAPEIFHENIDIAQKEAARVIETYNGTADGRIKVRVEPLNESLASREMIKAMHDVSLTYNVGMSMHLAEVRSRVDMIRSKYGVSSVEYLNDIGVLGPGTLLAHCIWIDKDDIALLAATDTRVVHNPVTNQYLADGVAPIPDLLKNGVKVALGADGAASNNNQDMFEVMKSAVLMQKVHTLNPLALTAEQALKMATIDAACALGMEDKIGSLEVGKKADIILIDLLRPEMTPAISIASNLVYAANGSVVDTVIIDGKTVMKNRLLTTMDEMKIIESAEKTIRRMIEETGSTALLTPGSWKVL
ncbi:MAG TPA: amidohydrolase [Atribacterota bacterium]|nr:amidohydrolase [Atribacterota bacterium]